MKVTKSNLAKLKTRYKEYLEGKDVHRFFDDFGINFAAGHWAAGDFCDRFAPVGYNSKCYGFKSGITSQIERVAKAGIKGVEFHEALFTDNNYKIDIYKIQEVKETLKSLM